MKARKIAPRERDAQQRLAKARRTNRRIFVFLVACGLVGAYGSHIRIQQRLAQLHKHHAQQAAQSAQATPETTIKIIMPNGSAGQLQGDALQGYRLSPADLVAE